MCGDPPGENVAWTLVGGVSTFLGKCVEGCNENVYSAEFRVMGL